MDCSPAARDDRTEIWLRPTQFTSYFVLAVTSLVVSIIFIMRIKRYMYLYYEEYRKWLLTNVIGLQVYMSILMIHLAREFVDSWKKYQQPEDYKSNLSIAEQYLIYYALEIIACIIMTFSRVTDDLFIQLNRERNILRISIFQYDYLSEINLQNRGVIKSSGDAEQLRNEIETAQ